MIFTKLGINCTNKTPTENPMTAMATHTNQTLLQVKMGNDAAQYGAFRVYANKN